MQTDMDRAANDEWRTSDVPSTAYDEKKEARSSLSSRESVRSERQNAEVVQEKEEEAEVEEGQVEQEQGQELEPVKSKQPSVNHAASIPDGGLWAWLQVLGAFFLFFNSWCVSVADPGDGVVDRQLTEAQGHYQHFWVLPDVLRNRAPHIFVS